MDQIPTDAFRIILTYLTNDHVSIYRLQMSCRLYHKLIRNDNELFDDMIQRQWIKGEVRVHTDDPRLEFELRCRLDASAIKCIRGMVKDLRGELGQHAVSMNGFCKIGEPWDHPNWKELLQLRSNVQDVLKAMANDGIDYSKEVLEQNLQRFLACRALVSIHTLDCLQEWKKISAIEPSDERRDLDTERFALLAVKAQMTPPELLRKTRPIENVVADQLDRIADDCRESVNACEHTIEKLGVLNQILCEDMSFTGNEEDYYNYKNSLLNHVLITKKGIPITLAILYTCIARRLSLKVDMIGLPGHLVLGFFDNVQGKHRFLDVFNGGRVLDLVDCQAIASAYGFTWQPHFVRPLDPTHVFLRILNNLSNCHGQTPISSSPPYFREMLSFQGRLLMLVHRQPRIAASLLERFSQDYLPLTLSIELLRLYELLAAHEHLVLIDGDDSSQRSVSVVSLTD